MPEEILKLPSDQDISGRNLGKEELDLLREVIESGVLNSTKGTKVPAFERAFADLFGVGHCVALASGTATIHAALVAINPGTAAEIITSPLTDMGAITPILYERCVPVFADVDPFSYNVTAQSIAQRITPKTKAIIVTHLFGNPCDMGLILELARRHRIPVIEDCAQSYLAEIDGKVTGRIGDIGAFSMQQGKHITTGEGGVAITDNDEYARRIRLFVNKAWGYGDKNPDHYFPALNYRLTELQGAVGLAQIKKLKASVEQRQRMARRMDERLASVEGIGIPLPPKGGTHVYWKYCLDVDREVLGFDVAELAGELKNFGIASAPRYIQKPAFLCQVLRESAIFRGRDESGWRREYPGAFQALSRVLVLPWNEFYVEKHVDYIADKILQSISKRQGSVLDI